jgi:hypothetical protein
MKADQQARRTAEHRAVAMRPMRDLLTDLRKLRRKLDTASGTDALGELNTRIADNAETVGAVCQNGMAALGHLLAHSAPVIEDGSIGADSIEAIGYLLAEIGDLNVACMLLAADLRQEAVAR